MKTSAFRAGAGRAVIQLPNEFFPVEGFTGIHDEICARALILECNIRVAIVSLELTSLPADEVTKLQAIVGKKMNIPIENVWICVTHTFSTPHFLPKFMLKTDADMNRDTLLRQAIIDAVSTSVSEAEGKLTNAVIGFQTGLCQINVNRDIQTIDGWWLGFNESGPSDKTVTVIRLNTQDGKPIAFLFHYSVQSSIMDGSVMSDGGRLVSADLAGAAARYVEQEYGGLATALFLVGAAGDQAPAMKARYMSTDSSGKLYEIDIHEEGFVLVRQLGERLGAEVVRIAEKTVCANAETDLFVAKRFFQCPGQQMTRDIKNLHPTREYAYLHDEEREMSIEAIRIGNLVLLGTKPELNCCTYIDIKEGSPMPHVIMITMVNGGAKYMADEDSYRRITYESMNSPFAGGSAEILRDEALKLLKELDCNTISD